MKTHHFKKHIFILALLLQTNFLFAQRYEWESFGESVSGSGNNAGGGAAIVRDGAGNLYSVAPYNSPVMIQGDTIQPLDGGILDNYIVKFNPMGQRIWTIPFGSLVQNDAIFDMTIDDSSNIYIFEHSFGFSIQFVDTVLNLANAVLIKIDSAGNFKWASQIPYTASCGKFIQHSRGFIFLGSCAGIHKVNCIDGNIISTLPLSGGWSTQKGITAAPNGDIITTYSITSTMTVDGVTLPVTASADGTGGNLAIIRIDTAMNVLAFKAYGNYVSTALWPVVADANNVYVCTQSTIVTNYFGTDSIIPEPYAGAFLKMDASLNPLSGVRIFKSDFHETNALMIANNGIYLGGNYGTVTYFNNGDSLPAAMNGDNLLVKMNFNGNVIWASGSGKDGATDRVNDLTNDGNGNCYFTGQDYGGDPKFSCKTTSAHPGMCIASFNDGSDAAPTPTITAIGNALTASPAFNETIQWYKNDTAIAGANGQTYTITEDGNYSVTYTNHYGCSSTSDTSFHQWVDGVSELQIADYPFQIYPNPANDLITIKSENNFNRVELFNMLGVSMIFNNEKTNQLKISVENIPNGNYFIKITDEKNNSVFKQITITH